MTRLLHRGQRRRLTLRQRVLAVFTCAAAVMLVVNAVSISLVRNSLALQIDSALSADAGIVAGSVNPKGKPAEIARQVSDMATVIGVVAVTTTGSGRRTAVGSPDGVVTLNSVKHFPAGISSKGAWRFFTVKTGSGLLITVGRDTHSLLTTNLVVTLEQLLSTIASLLVLVVMSSWMMSTGVKPFAQIAALARRISDGQRGERVKVPVRMEGTEYSDVAMALNSMLDGLESLLAQELRLTDELRRFVSDAGHELRTPLTVLSGYGDLLRSGTLGPERQHDALARIGSETARMSRLVEDLLALAKLERGEELRYARFDIAELLHELVSDHRTVDTNNEHPMNERVAGSMVVDADEDRISQVVVNILANFRTHTPVGTSAVLSLSQRRGGVQISYADNGPGVDEPEKVLDRFWQNDPGRRGSNSGLGMAISAAIVALLRPGELLGVACRSRCGSPRTAAHPATRVRE